MVEQTKTLSRWRFDLQRGNKKVWLAFYSDMLGVQASSIPRLYKALNLYGFWPLFEAIVAASDKDLDGDPLNYVLKIASNKWKEKEQEDENGDEYISDIEAAKIRSKQANEELARKILRSK